MPAPHRILITGATGNIGRALLRVLQSHPGLDLVAAVRDPARAALPPEVRPVHFDFADPATYAPALVGCRSLLLLRPPQVTDSFASLLKKAKQAGVQRVVFISVQGAEHNPLLPHSRTERVLRRTGLPHTILRPAYFMQNFTTVLLPDLIERRRIFLPAGSARFTLIDIDDIARAAASVLLAPGLDHDGKAYPLTAQTPLTFGAMADILSAGLGTRITYISPAPWRFYRTKRAEDLPRPFALILLLLHFLPRFTAPPPTSPALENLTGRPPTEFPQFVAAHRALLLGEESPKPVT